MPMLQRIRARMAPVTVLTSLFFFFAAASYWFVEIYKQVNQKMLVIPATYKCIYLDDLSSVEKGK